LSGGIDLDRIRIKDFEIYGYHGVNIQEKEMGQRFIVSIDVFMDLRKAGKSDSILETVNYAQLCYDVENEFKRKKLDLIETAAENVASYVLKNYELVERIIVEIKKPWAPIGKPLDYASVQIERSWHTAYIAVGSNMGDKQKNINDAIDIINNDSECRVTKVSNMYETKPVGFVEQDDFLNGAFEIRTLFTPHELMDKLFETEKVLKRERVIHWGPRTIDLDIIFYDSLISCDDKVILPHPRMQERLFVLKPLCDIAPYFMHPILKKRVIDLYEEQNI
jgi:dihydroneopterin aldolase / 2-amino-4-hydroxy-6-hydroxymethyldihydropteridine diphosphokinase